MYIRHVAGLTLLQADPCNKTQLLLRWLRNVAYATSC